MVTTRSSIKHKRQIDSPKHASKTRSPSTKSTNAKTPKSAITNDKSHKQAIIDIKNKMNDLLSKLTSSSSTICPSQIARGLNKDHTAKYPDWRAMMDPVRDVVWEEVRKGKVEVTQGGVSRSLEDREGLKGPIRVRRGREWGD